jgi:hypothetical protein
VLLGDAVELRQGPMRDGFAAARPFFEALGAALRPGAEVVLVPGNHDHALAGPWLERRRRDAEPPPLGLAEVAEIEPEDPVAAIAAWVAPASFAVAYPGIWLRDDVYATHGHYLDYHSTLPTFERIATGLMRRIVGQLPDGGATPDDYEAALAPLYAWIHSVSQHARGDVGGAAHGASVRAWRALVGGRGRKYMVRRRLLGAAFPLAVGALNRAGVGPLRADVSGAELSRAGVLAMAEVAERLGVRASHVLFGHTHRSGPWPQDDLAEWTTPSGARLMNAGSWVYERHFLTPTPSESPYWPGCCMVVEDEEPPRLVRLLGDRGHAELSGLGPGPEAVTAAS